MAPSFAAGAITGEKDDKSYEMLLASPLRPGAIVLGKLLASLCHLAILIFCSLPIVMLCLPLGGVSLYEVLAVYLAVILVGRHLRHDQPGGEQLFSPHLFFAGGLVFAGPPVGAGGLFSWRVLESAAEFRLFMPRSPCCPWSRC